MQSPANPAMAAAWPLHKKVPTTSRWPGGSDTSGPSGWKIPDKSTSDITWTKKGSPKFHHVKKSWAKNSPIFCNTSFKNIHLSNFWPGRWRSTCWHWDDCGKRGEVPFLLSYVSGGIPMLEWPGAEVRRRKNSTKMWGSQILVLKAMKNYVKIM